MDHEHTQAASSRRLGSRYFKQPYQYHADIERDFQENNPSPNQNLTLLHTVSTTQPEPPKPKANSNRTEQASTQLQLTPAMEAAQAIGTFHPQSPTTSSSARKRAFEETSDTDTEAPPENPFKASDQAEHDKDSSHHPNKTASKPSRSKNDHYHANESYCTFRSVADFAMAQWFRDAGCTNEHINRFLNDVRFEPLQRHLSFLNANEWLLKVNSCPRFVR